jgi:hypothetical protein
MLKLAYEEKICSMHKNNLSFYLGMRLFISKEVESNLTWVYYSHLN